MAGRAGNGWPRESIIADVRDSHRASQSVASLLCIAGNGTLPKARHSAHISCLVAESMHERECLRSNSNIGDHTSPSGVIRLITGILCFNDFMSPHYSTSHTTSNTPLAKDTPCPKRCSEDCVYWSELRLASLRFGALTTPLTTVSTNRTVSIIHCLTTGQ